jgi:hypothetical protein
MWEMMILLSLAPQPSVGLGLLLKIRLKFLEASQQFSFLQGRVVSPTPNPHPRGPGLCIYIPQRNGGYIYIYQVAFSMSFTNQFFFAFLFSPMRATCPAHYILPDLIILTILGTKHKLRSGLLWSITFASKNLSFQFREHLNRYTETIFVVQTA